MSTQSQPVSPTVLGRPAEQVAWLTLWGGFAILVFVFLMIGVALQWYVFQSTTALNAELHVGRGTVGIRNVNNDNQQAVRINYDISRNETASTDEIAQGNIEFIDSSRENRVIANVIVLPGSQVRLAEATRPRFSFGDERYHIVLEDFEGRLEIEIPPNLDKPIEINISGTHGEILLEEAGYYLMWSLPDSMTIIPRNNPAILQPFNDGPIIVPANETAQLNANSQTVSVYTTTDEIVRNPLFKQASQPSVPDTWRCYSTAANLDTPRGQQLLQTVDGRRALWIHREGELIGSGETGCRQFFGDGLDVSDYLTLRLRTMFNIRWQSLSICGTQASECPLMVELTYLNEAGQEQRWIHGFYAFDHNNFDVPLACNSCLLDHDRVLPNTWYVYESSNLFELPEGFRPTVLQQIRFYVSGHEYEVVVSEISLLGER